jgi:hypothetical protein
MPFGGRFGINNHAVPVAIRLETGEGMDDIEVSQSDRGTPEVQCKTSVGLSTVQESPLAKTVGQLARWVADEKAAGDLPDPSPTAPCSPYATPRCRLTTSNPVVARSISAGAGGDAWATQPRSARSA